MEFDISTLITDRTADDVRLETDKGHYNASDLNRVGLAMEYLSKRFASYGYTAPVSPKTDWVIEDIPTIEQMANYLKDLATLRGVYSVLQTTPSVPPDMKYLTYGEANDIEQILSDIEFVINQVVRSFRRSDAFGFWSGANPFPSAENDMGRTWEELDAMNTEWVNWQVADWYLLLYGNLKAEGVVE